MKKNVCPNEECLSENIVHKSQTPTPCFENDYFCRSCGKKFKTPKEVESETALVSETEADGTNY